MAKSTLSSYLRRLKQAMAVEAMAECSDRVLVECFRERRDDDAFRCIIDRHGPMVFHVCRRILTSTADVEDAFQATFLVLVRRGHTIRKQASLASWLHGVARRTSLKLRTQLNRRQRREGTVANRTAQLSDDTTWGELRGVLDDELQRLPETCRSSLVLCYLEGRTQDEAAAQLDVSKSTLRRRLDRGREILGRRLAQRGVTIGSALGTCLITESVSSAAISRALIERTSESAVHTANKLAAPACVLSPRVAAISDGVIRAMTYAKYQTVFAVVACVLALGVGIPQFAPTSVSAQDQTRARIAKSATPAPDIDPIDPTLVFDAEVQKQLKLSQNQVRQLTEAHEKGTVATVEQGKRVKEIDQQLRQLQDEMDRLNKERGKLAQGIHHSQTEHVKAAIPNVLSRDAVEQLRQITIQRMSLADILLDRKMRARLDLNDEQVKRIQELAESRVDVLQEYSLFSHAFIERPTAATLPSDRVNVSGINFYLAAHGTESRAELLKILSPKQREALERLSGMNLAPKK